MNEESAWERFSTTGHVIDYLVYASIRNANREKNEGEKMYANQYGRASDSGKTDI